MNTTKPREDSKTLFIDSHAHLTSSTLSEHVEEILSRAQDHHVEKIVNICTDAQSLEKGLLLSKRHPWIYHAAATTPHDVEKDGEAFFPIAKKHAHDLVALGETGLDYYYEHSNRTAQQEFLVRYFELAKEMHLPLIFHCRDAFGDLFALADAHYKGRPAVLHCFTGSAAEAKGCLDRGWLISFSGIITFKKSAALREAVTYVPLERMLIETDAPYLAPESKRGKVNEPSFIVETAGMVAQLKKLDLVQVAQQTTKNASQFFSFR